MDKQDREIYALEWMSSAIPSVGIRNFNYEDAIGDIASSIVRNCSGNLQEIDVDNSVETLFDVIYCQLLNSETLGEATENYISWLENGNVSNDDGVEDFFPVEYEPETQVA